jgi:hypothetical protein
MKHIKQDLLAATFLLVYPLNDFFNQTFFSVRQTLLLSFYHAFTQKSRDRRKKPAVSNPKS